MARLIEVTAYLTARAHGTGLPVSQDAFEVPGWETDTIKQGDEGLRVWLSRAIRVEDCEDDMARAVQVAEEEGLSAPEGWEIVEIDLFPHVDLGPAPDTEPATRPF